ncbi:MAG: cell division topological specificity factor MinE, partial [Ectothiorhodospiraceae bacterium]|nr:cell division topological specificity factor MinE [Ectothiorhodospiraceae bacterium]
LLAVIRKYVEVDNDAVTIQLDREGDCEVLELNITLPDGRGR